MNQPSSVREDPQSVPQVLTSDKHRAVSAREAAALQSFPDDFVFVGSMEAVSRQIGNAVPPLLARRLAEVFLPAHW
ncbi:DNA cytosine methyltransferase [Methylorubrum extorquens]|uniref:DNA cytosine methyltransferase n=1 Tax=Methylorubrum extorquens TaxID=408 RepID=UPI0009E2BB4C|nr:DNA cytosine methyltransferase [Methylorubrum extorquens]MCP1546006.1 site-specific DNA-cytosine methylase [Methylorubrum extorquens]MCP1590673.1 site-specific DNA-cytosine methylase [Methylorubrum extorquens]